MGAFKYINALWRKKQSDVMRFVLRIRAWEGRQSNSIERVSHPTRPEKAHQVGYKAKQGFVIYSVRIRRGGRKKQVAKGKNYGKPKSAGIALKGRKNLQAIAEARVGTKIGSLRVLSSYWVNQDAKYKWYEVVMVDPMHEAIRGDAGINWIATAKHNHREQRGLTASGKQHRGLTKRGYRSNKQRPSRRAVWKRQNTRSFARRR